jgi:hypothetical protein
MLVPSMTAGQFIRRSSHFGSVDAGVEVMTASLITCSVIRSTDAAIADTDVMSATQKRMIY